MHKISVIITLSVLSLFAGDTLQYTTQIGLGAGFVTGVGFQYRGWTPSGYGVQFNAGPYFSFGESQTEYSLSLGVAGLKRIKKGETKNLFMYGGMHLLSESYEEQHEDIYGYTKSISDQRTTFMLGGGPGVEFNNGRWVVNVMAGLMYLVNSKDYAMFTMTGEISILYSIKTPLVGRK